MFDRNYLKRVLKIVFYFFFSLLVGLTILFSVVSSAPSEQVEADNILNDVTGLNPVVVNGIYHPKSIDEIVRLVKDNNAISIGGARHSMGGQIGEDHSIHLNMRKFSQIISFSKEEKVITVETGITWRKIQEYIDQYGLSVRIMQTYANFTVGGSLSVNVHGRYIGEGPLIHSVKSIKVVLPDGQLITASPIENPEIFYGCIGGYGGLGVIVEATLNLTDNCKVARQSETMPLNKYQEYFFDHIREDSSIVFHNADIYPNDFTEVRAVSYVKTDKPLTVNKRLRPLDANYRFERFAMWMVSELPCGKWMRKTWADPIFYSDEKVEWRNYEASYNSMELEPTSRKNSTYVLQEYFIPVNHLNSFVPKMAKVFHDYHVNVINVSIRHAKKDKGSLLAWARTEVFCLVVYYKQETTLEESKKVGEWTRMLIDASISEGGSYYLPYQIHATEVQFKQSYPQSNKFFELKRKVDPTNKFRNRLWDAYYQP